MKALQGNLIVGQSGGPSAVINNSVAGVIHTAQQHQCITGIYGMRHGIQGFLQEDLLDLGRETSDWVDGLRITPSAALGSCRYKVTVPDYERILALCQAHNIRYFFYIGGNDSMDTADQIRLAADSSGYELRVIGIPKTIDNDLPYTDHTPGYGSAARYEAISFSEARRDSLALHFTEVVKIFETMGRNAGWLTAATALAGDFGPDLVYVPERPFDEDRFLGDVDDCCRRQGFATIAVCEGVRRPDGTFVWMNQDALNTDAFGHPEPGVVGEYLASLTAARLKLKSRVDKPGTLQRSAGQFISKVDAQEAYLVGGEAVRCAVEGESGYMITLERTPGETYHCQPGKVALGMVKNYEKLLPDEFIHPNGRAVTEAFCQYAFPLLGDPLPAYIPLAKHLVEKRLA